MPRTSTTIPVPSADGSANLTIADVIGNKSDTHDGDSIAAGIETLKDHVHHPGLVYPTMAAGTTVTSSATAWTLGSFAEVVPVSTITSDFDIHHVSIESLSANGVYELVIYEATTERGRVRFVKNAAQDGTVNVDIQTTIMAANAQVQAKLATDNAVADTADISLFYHTY